MKINISDNIRRMRKERGLTQDQLAQALGVTVGAVSKWESGASVPELEMILDIARFFETSVDVLVGYGWHKGGMGEAVERIRQLKRRKELDKAMAEAEQALLKYPNSFDLVYESAMVHFLTTNPRHQNRAIELFQLAGQLIDQNTNEKIGPVTIQNFIAYAYMALGQDEKALELLRQNNFDGLNNGAIGLVLAQRLRKADEALPYLSDALLDLTNGLYRVCIGYANAYCQKKDYDNAIGILLWLQQLVEGQKLPGKVSCLDKEDVVLLGACAQLYALKGDPERTREYLRRARKVAVRFDAAPDHSMRNVKYYHSERDAIAFDDIAETALEAIETLMANEEAGPLMRSIWEDLNSEDRP